MKTFAQITEVNGSKLVTDSIVLPDNVGTGPEEYIKNVLGLGGEWIQCDDSRNLRKNRATVGDTYDPKRRVFIPPKPEKNESYVFNEKRWMWVPPLPHPTDRHPYLWNEEKKQWVRVENAPSVPASWAYDEDNDLFVPPVPKPSDGKRYRWHEPSLSWIEFVAPIQQPPSKS